MSNYNRAHNAVTEDRIRLKCEEIGDTYIGYYRGKNKRGRSQTIIQFICNNHPEKGVQERDWDHFSRYKKGCVFCHGKNKTTDDFKKEIAKKNPNVEILNEYTGSNTRNRIECRCKICGYEWDTAPASLRNGSGCPVCGRVSAERHGMFKGHDQFIKDLHRAQPNIEIISPYVGSHKRIWCRCNVHNCEWWSYPANLLNRSARCPMCVQDYSKGELRIKEYLDSHEIIYTHEYCFEDCYDLRPLPFDFYLLDYNICIEFDGQQHYEPIAFDNRSDQQVTQDFYRIIKHDKIKTEYCNNHGIVLIRIPYWNYDSIELILNEYLDPQRLSDYLQ